MDFGAHNLNTVNQPKSFQSLMSAIAPNGSNACNFPIHHCVRPHRHHRHRHNIDVADRVCLCRATHTRRSRNGMDVSAEPTARRLVLSERLCALHKDAAHVSRTRVYRSTKFGDILTDVVQGVETPNESSTHALDSHAVDAARFPALRSNN